MDDAHRETTDAPRRRWLLLLLLGLVPVGGLIVLGGLALFGRKQPPPPPPAPAAAPLLALPAPEPLPPPPPPPPPSPPPRALAKAPRTVTKQKASPGRIVVGTVTGGDATVRKALLKAFRGALRVDVVDHADSGYAITVIVDKQEQSGDDVTVRCAVSVAELPLKKVVASLKARADVTGENTDVGELMDDAATACGQTLGKDISAWVARHPPP